MSEATAPSPDRVWALWRGLKRLFPVWSTPYASVFTPGAWRMLGNDLVSGLKRNRNTGQATALLADATPAELDSLSDIAALNVRRHDQLFRAIFILSVTVPVAVVATWSDVAPETLKAWVNEDRTRPLVWLAYLAGGVGLYWMGVWRAHQMVSVLDLIRIDRGMRLLPAPSGTAEP